MSSLLAAMLVLFESGSVPRAQPPRALLEVRGRPELWLVAAPMVDPRGARPSCGLLGCDLSRATPSWDQRDLTVHTQNLLVGMVTRLGLEPVSNAASWFDRSGLQLDIQSQRLVVSLRFPAP